MFSKIENIIYLEQPPDMFYEKWCSEKRNSDKGVNFTKSLKAPL